MESPVLSELDGLRLENLFLKVQQQTWALEKLKADLQALIVTLQRAGYTIGPNLDGRLVYLPGPVLDGQPVGLPANE